MWQAASPAERARTHGFALCLALYLLHTVFYTAWYVEDAAITFTYAKHLAAGEGPVAWLGGEPTEGFSNPTWTLLLAAIHWCGVNPFIAAKVLGVLLGGVALWAAWRWAEDALTPPDGPRDPVAQHAALVAPLLLASSPQFVAWNMSGLECALHNALLGLGAVGWMRDARAPRRWWLAPTVAIGLLAITRPEGPAYAGLIALVAAGTALQSRGWRGALSWVASRGAPSLMILFAWLGYRHLTFAWPLPNTYYAKLGDHVPFDLFAWNGMGWNYVRNWALATGAAFALPVYLLGVLGPGKRRWQAMVGLTALVCLLFIPGLGWATKLPGWPFQPEPELLRMGRVSVLLTLALVLPTLALSRRGAPERLLAGWLFAFICVYALVAEGDWMSGYRWFGLGSLPWTVLLATGMHAMWCHLRDSPNRFVRHVPATIVLLGFLAGAGNSVKFLQSPVTTPFDVSVRVAYMDRVKKRLHLDHAVAVEVDFGAHMWWSGNELIDLAGLTDVPIGHHNWQAKFMADYVYQDRLPDFMHAHGFWAKKSRIDRPAGWKDYVELPGYPSSRRSFHVGNLVRRELILPSQWPHGGERSAWFSREIRLMGVHIPAPTLDRELFVELGWKLPHAKRAGTFRPVLFASHEGAVVASWELPPAYDWVPTGDWGPADVAIGRHALPLPADLPPGAYDLGLIVTRERGTVVPALGNTHPPVFARGEVLWPGAIEVLVDASPLAEAAMDAARQAARDGDCAHAEAQVATGRRHVARELGDALLRQMPLRSSLAHCWMARADIEEDREPAQDALVRARRWDHRIGRSSSLADRWEARGDNAMVQGKLNEAHQAYTLALLADPTRAWLRRHTEALRDERLGL
jgi:hypothetical protein